MKQGTRERLALIETEARRLARSGDHRGSWSIGRALQAQGFAEASKVLANRWTQSELDRICEQVTLRQGHLTRPAQAA
jgi:hypothetical protein